MKKIIPALFVVLMLTGCGYTVETPGEELMETIPEEAPSLDEQEIANMEEVNKEIRELLQSTETIPEDASILYDIQIRSSETSILIDRDDSEIIWYAEIPIDCEPEIVYLIDADTGETVAELRDEADYEKYGDTIKGDSVYNCRFHVNTDIDTDPNVSEDTEYHYYAEFTENNITHRSETVDIWTAETFTDKELGDMEAVDDAVSELIESKEYQNASDEEKQEQAIALLKELSVEGTPDRPYSLIIPETIIEGDLISFQYACGVGGGIKITPFNSKMN